MAVRRAFAAALLACALPGCGPAETDPGPGGVTVGEAQALDEAAEMIEQRRLPDAALPEGTLEESSPEDGTSQGSTAPAAPEADR